MAGSDGWRGKVCGLSFALLLVPLAAQPAAARHIGGVVVAWGAVSTPAVPPREATKVAAGARHGLAVRHGGSVVAWGDNAFGQAAVPGNLTGVVTVAAGARHSLALRGDGTVAAWGTGTPEQVYVNGEFVTHNVATPPATLREVTAIATSSRHGIALTKDGLVTVWGLGRVGLATPPPAALTDVSAVAAGELLSVALRRDGTVVAWGDGAKKASGAVDANGVPLGLAGVTAISAGGRHTLALRSDGTVIGWGSNDSGESTPPPGLANVTAIAAGDEHSVALKADGTVVEWGRGSRPRGVATGLTTVTGIAAGGFTVAITKMGKPTAPVGVSLHYRGTTATVSWSAPVYVGAPEISHYTVRTSPTDAGVRVPATQLSYQLVGVRPAEGLSVSVEAEAAGGLGASATAYARRANIRVFRPDVGRWYDRTGVPVAYGTSGDVPVPGDYDGDGVAEIAVFRPVDGTWRVRGSQPVRYGRTGDLPVPADYNGDGTTDLAVFRPANGNWYIRGIGDVHLGRAGDIPVAGDYNGDGAAELIIFRPENGMWYTVPPNRIGINEGILSIGLLGGSRRFGIRGDIPAPGDWNGDGTLELGVFRPATGMWYRPERAPVRLGQQGDIPVPGDYDVNGVTDIGVYRPGSSTFYLRGVGAVALGRLGDLPLVDRPQRAPLRGR